MLMFVLVHVVLRIKLLSLYIIYICHGIIVMHCVNPVAQQKVLHPADTTIVVSPMYSAMFVVV